MRGNNQRVTSAKRKKREREKETATHSHPPVGPRQSKGKKCFSNGSLGDSICSGSWLRGLRSSGFQPAAERTLGKAASCASFDHRARAWKGFHQSCGFPVVRQFFLAATLQCLRAAPVLKAPGSQRVLSSFELDSKDTAGCSKNPEPEACSWEASIALLVMRKLEEEEIGLMESQKAR